MGVLYDYFTAASDEDAAATIGLQGGPGGAEPASPELHAAVCAGDRAAVERLARPRVRVSEHGLQVLSAKGIDPVIQMETLEGLLTGVSTEATSTCRHSDQLVALRDEGERLVLSLSGELQHLLAEQTPEELDAVAVRWAQAEESWGDDAAGALGDFLREFSQFARGARDRGHRLYCWVCV